LFLGRRNPFASIGLALSELGKSQNPLVLARNTSVFTVKGEMGVASSKTSGLDVSGRRGVGLE
jgi:hypothetical protein